jgi:flagellar basal-body rod protein FlgB
MPDIPFFNVLRQRMSWLDQRQSVLSQNVANADTPGYEAQDLKPLDFERLMQEQSSSAQFSPSLSVTDPRHIAIATPGGTEFSQEDSADTEANPTGNTVSLEQEMIKVSDTTAQYQAASNLYAKALNMMRTAIGH